MRRSYQSMPFAQGLSSWEAWSHRMDLIEVRDQMEVVYDQRIRSSEIVAAEQGVCADRK